ncbi:HSP20 family protein [Nannocystis exedens]|uniref:HSP20 family protein n=1 Tax=Nannocystis exedens TaxID=54 RepID=A0A1I1UF33_9BACT|nr:Hsp20/alpha crystallin family protein [Nannocystis exedens]PCC71659.1 heat-shock protein Hsp20 [Nannocystis exedens]SFD69379.1 HSP20 family protein [Nannocystis exedens]
MSLLPWKKNQPASNLMSTQAQMSPFQQDMHRMFDRVFGRFPLGFEQVGNYPTLSVSDCGDSVMVRAEVPGLDAKDVELTVEGNILTLRGEKREETRDENENYFYHERSFGSFIRRIELPCHVDSNNADAHLEKGVLTLKMPKIVGESCRTIKIQDS